jgi:mono/diheme cytochrome c family protein
MDTGMLHSHKLVVSLYLLQLLVRVILMVAAKPETVAKYTKALRVPHIVLSILMLVTGVYLMVKAPAGVQPYILVKLGLVLASVPLGVLGSKRNSVALTGLAFLLLAGTMAISFIKPSFLRTSNSSAIDPGKTGDADAATLKEGQALYEKYCVLCHGADGGAGFQGAKDLAASTLADAEIVNLIQHGKGVMPANTDLSDAEAQKVKDYVKYLRK